MTEPLVLIPGLMSDARVFAPQLAAFSTERAVMVASLAEGETIREMARNVLESAPEKFALAGHSMGGIVAMEVLRQAGDRVTRIALMDTNPQPETPRSAASYEPLLVAAKAGRLEETLRQFMVPDFLAPGPQRIDIINMFVEMGLQFGGEVFARQIRALQRRPDQQSTLRRCKVPALALCGADDQLTPPKRHSFMAELIPFAQFQVIEGAGHMPMLEQPDATNAALRDWLKQPYVLR